MTTDKQFEIQTELTARWRFWLEMPPAIRRYQVRGKRQNDYPADVRAAWVDWVDAAQKGGRMSEALASEVTL